MPNNDNTRIQTRSSTNRELYDTISAIVNSSSLDILRAQKALQGLNPDMETATPNSVLKTKSGSCVNRPRSVSFSTPEVREGFVRGAAALNSDSFISSASPIRMRSHCSEAGSPTLEQAILMGRNSPGSDAGYGSFQSGAADLTSLSELRRGEDDSPSPTSRPGDRSFSPGEPRPTLASLVEADLAVAQAVQNLQELKDRQAAIYQEVGVLKPLKEVGVLNPLKETHILSALLSATQASRQTEFSTGLRDEIKREKLPFSDSTPFDREPRDNMDREYMNSRDTLERSRDPLALERAARQYRNAASIHEANCTWSGQLPPKQQAGRQSSFSSKIFLGGVPWDITENALIQAFIDFGPVRIEWPGREAASPPRGYLYIVFDDEDRVKDLLANCTHDYSNGGSYYYKISSKKRGSKEIQIIPWLVADSNYVRFPSPRLDPKKTVFVGALHGMINAQNLALIFNDLFGGVVYAGLDTDKHKYPIGSGRVTFNNSKSYMKAVAAAFIEIKTPRFCKKVQVDPYLEDALCSVCHIKQGPYFCRDLNCFNYYCRSCWDQQHAEHSFHKPLMRNIRGLTRARLQDILPESGDCYTSLYQNTRDNKMFLDFFDIGDKEKRPEMENWRSAYLDRPDSWRPSNLDKQSESWRSLPEITWRNQEKINDVGSGIGWAGQNGDIGWSDDYSKLASAFTDSLSLNSERMAEFKQLHDPPSTRTVFDRDSTSFQPLLGCEGYQRGPSSLQQLTARDQGRHSFQHFLERDAANFQDFHPRVEQEAHHQRESGSLFQSLQAHRDQAGFKEFLDREEGRLEYRFQDKEPWGLRPLIKREDIQLRSLIDREPGNLGPVLEQYAEDGAHL